MHRARGLRGIAVVILSRTTLTDADGTFTLAGLAPQRYTVHARAGGRNGYTSDVDAGRRDVVVTVADPGSIEGMLEGFAETPAIVIMNWGGRARAPVAGTTFRVANARPGHYQIAATTNDGGASVTVNVEPGKTARVTLRFQRYGSIAGTFQSSAKLRHCQLSSDGDARYILADARGQFRFDRLTAGEYYVSCGFARGVVVTVRAGETSHVEIVEEKRTPDAPTSYTGMTVEYQLANIVRVSFVDANGPAARAGVRVGDFVLEVNDLSLENAGGWRYAVEAKPPGTTVKLKLERAERELDVQLVLAPKP